MLQALARRADQAALIDRFNRLMESWLGGKSEATRRAYRGDMIDFARFLGVQTFDAAARALVGGDQATANDLALCYRNDLIDRELAPATTNRRLTALRSLVDLANMIGIAAWTLRVRGVRVTPYRDTRGCTLEGFRLMYHAFDERTDAKGVRDRALLRLLYDLALRRGEVVRLDAADVDLEAGTLSIIGKGKTEPELRTLPEQTKVALAAWLGVRGIQPGPLFINFARHARRGERLTGGGLWGLVHTWGRAVGIVTRPHGIRHTAITQALVETNGNISTVQRFSRHANPATVMIYADNLADDAGEVAKLVAAKVA